MGKFVLSHYPHYRIQQFSISATSRGRICEARPPTNPQKLPRGHPRHFTSPPQAQSRPPVPRFLPNPRPQAPNRPGPQKPRHVIAPELGIRTDMAVSRGQVRPSQHSAPLPPSTSSSSHFPYKRSWAAKQMGPLALPLRSHRQYYSWD
ncbi:hypothetical protein CRG98_033518 [Punica granatum]|uniref:Uncharacterized protein n=1 Tax=Punica granatum TaxID=22663 RepID=A0A2I0IQS2_PUNGR|nr:hypothetical protein CRG98_033518 [Punica granatum]